LRLCVVRLSFLAVAKLNKMTNGNDLIHSFNHTPDTEGNFKGLTKREYFAGLAMQGIVSNQEFLKNLNAEPDLIVTAILEITDKLIERMANEA